MFERRVARLAKSALSVLALAVVACGERPAPAALPPVPSERMVVVAAVDTPWLSAPRTTKEAIEVGFRGQLVEVMKPMPSMDWKAAMGDKTGVRAGAMIEARYSRDDGLLYGFASDMGDAVDAPAASFICAAVARELGTGELANERCTGMLRRVRAPDGSFVAHVPCFVGRCAVAKVDAGRVSAIALEGLTDARPVLVPGGLVLLARTRWSEDAGRHTGGRISVIGFNGEAPVVLGALPTDEVDARDPAVVISRSANVEITARDGENASLRVRGETASRRPGDDGSVAATPFDELYQVSAAKLERSR